MKNLLILVLLIPPLVILQRYLQREIQSIFLLLTRHPEISMALFSLIFFPGVLLHESSHYLTARLLGVRTGRFSLIPRKMDNGRLQLGYVETASTDFLRDSMIGVAPLVVGGVFIALIGVSKMGVTALWEHLAQWEASAFVPAIRTMINQPDFWLWFYLTFTVSSTLMPSPSDRKAWVPLILVVAIMVGVVLLLGAGPWLLTRFGSLITSALQAVTVVFSIAILVHLVLVPPAWVTRKILSRATGYQVV